jgi:hypothetical protein
MKEQLEKIQELLDSNNPQNRVIGKEMLARFREVTVVPEHTENCVQWMTARTRRRSLLLIRMDPGRMIWAHSGFHLNVEDIVWRGHERTA